MANKFISFTQLDIGLFVEEGFLERTKAFDVGDRIVFQTGYTASNGPDLYSHGFVRKIDHEGIEVCASLEEACPPLVIPPNYRRPLYKVLSDVVED